MARGNFTEVLFVEGQYSESLATHLFLLAEQLCPVVLRAAGNALIEITSGFEHSRQALAVVARDRQHFFGRRLKGLPVFLGTEDSLRDGLGQGPGYGHSVEFGGPNLSRRYHRKDRWWQ